jgi:glycosyltransferase involved in cell wall biosynthesis
MKVLYDHQVFSCQKFGGISRYFYELMNHSEGLFEYEVSGIYSENEYIRDLRLYKEFPIKRPFKGKARILNILNKADSIKKIRQKKYDIIHPTYYAPYILKSKYRPLIITVHDMIHELFPDYVSDKYTISNKKKMIANADRIIAISENTKRDIVNIYPEIDERKIFVIYHGYSYNNDIILNEVKEKYILFTGQRGGYKNFKNFVNAVSPLLIKYDLFLFCTGNNFSIKEKRFLEKNGIIDRVICRFVSDVELINIYTNAIAFVFPSLYEGFGIPVLEAFAAGCPAILANASCFPEIAGNAALYFDPYSETDMRNTIEKVIVHSDIAKTLVEKGYERLSLFSWEKTIKQTYKIYQEII